VFPRTSPGVFGQHRGPYQCLPVFPRAVPGKRDLDRGGSATSSAIRRTFRASRTKPVQPEIRVTWIPAGTTFRARFPGVAAHAAFTSQTIEPHRWRASTSSSTISRYGCVDVRRRRGPEDIGQPVRGVEYSKGTGRAVTRHVTAAPTTYKRFDWKERQGGPTSTGRPIADGALRDYSTNARTGSCTSSRSEDAPGSAGRRFFHPSGVFATVTALFRPARSVLPHQRGPSTPRRRRQRPILDLRRFRRLPPPRPVGIVSIEGKNLFDRRSSTRTRTRSARSSSPSGRCISR